MILNDEAAVFGKANRGRHTTVRQYLCLRSLRRMRKINSSLWKLEKLLQKVQAKYVMLSYSSGGKATKKNCMISLLRPVNC